MKDNVDLARHDYVVRCSYGCAGSSVKQYLLVLLYGTSAHCPTLKKSVGLSAFGSEYRFLASSNAIYHASRPVAKVMH